MGDVTVVAHEAPRVAGLVPQRRRDHRAVRGEVRRGTTLRLAEGIVAVRAELLLAQALHHPRSAVVILPLSY